MIILKSVGFQYVYQMDCILLLHLVSLWLLKDFTKFDIVDTIVGTVCGNMPRTLSGDSDLDMAGLRYMKR